MIVRLEDLPIYLLNGRNAGAKGTRLNQSLSRILPRNCSVLPRRRYRVSLCDGFRMPALY